MPGKSQLEEQAVALIKELMEVQGLSANALSQRCSVDQTTISRMLRGAGSTMETLDALFAALGFRAYIEIEAL